MPAAVPLALTTTTALTANPRLLDQLLAPAGDMLDNYVRDVYREGPFDDFEFLRCGVLRTLGQYASGRDFLQAFREVFEGTVARATFFKSLHSADRCERLASVNTELVRRAAGTQSDLLARFPELKGRALYGVDGHHVAHATHSPTDDDGDYVSANSLYLLCLHTGLLCNLGVVQGDGVRRHEMPVFRARIGAWWARQGPRRRGAKPIFVGDPAFVDKTFWTRMTLAHAGLELITRTKANMKPTIFGERVWDPDLPINEGVLADQRVGFKGSCVMRIIRYRDPENGTEYEFLTTVKDLAPGLIALIYLTRWRIEKVFDTAKNQFEETKAWAVGEIAQDIRAHFFALTHNLLMLLRRQLDVVEGIVEEKTIHKRHHALKRRERQAQADGRKVATIHSLLPAVVQLTAQFIRTLRNGIVAQMRWRAALEPLRATMKAYL